MAVGFRLVFLLSILTPLFASKLNLPRVLLPLFKASSINFTLEVTDGGCYKWTPSRLDIVQIIPVDLNKEYDCSSKVVLSTITKEFTQNTVIILVEEVFTKEVLRCDVIVDVINSLSIITKTRRLFVEESPEIFEVRAYDKEGNEFSTLEGVRFSWDIESGGRNDKSGKNNVLRFINFKDSRYSIPATIQHLDSRGLAGHFVLLEGVKTGTAYVSVELGQLEYRHVPSAKVQLNVIANLIVEPADTYMLRGDIVHYKLLRVKDGRFMEVKLPSLQYSLIVENGSVARQIRPWVIETLVVGQTRLILSDVNSKMSNVDDETYLPSVMLNVVTPSYMDLVFMPFNNWFTTLYQPNTVVVELYDDKNQKIFVGPNVNIDVEIDSLFKIVDKTRNGSYIDGYAREIGVAHVVAEFNSVRTNNNDAISFERVLAEADIHIYDNLLINPPQIAVPWDPIESSKLQYQLNVSGGDGHYQWNVTNSQIAFVTQKGVLKPRKYGTTEVTSSMQKNPAIQTSAELIVAPANKLKIVYNSIESELGSPIYLSIALFYKSNGDGYTSTNKLFTECTGFPFQIELDNRDFYYNASDTTKRGLGAACTTLAIVGNRAGTAVVTVSYASDIAGLLSDKATVSAYRPLRIVHPEKKKSILSVGAQTFVVLAGGPSTTTITNGDGHRVKIDYNESIISLDTVWGAIVDDEVVYLATCRTLGTVKIVFSVIEGDDELTGSRQDMSITCARPHSVSLYSDLVNTEVQSCRQAFLSQNPVVNSKPISLRIVVKDASGNTFDNATSLEMKWSLSNENLCEIRHPGTMKLFEEDKGRYRIARYHYQIIDPKDEIGKVEVTVRATDYRKFWLKKLDIGWLEEESLKIVAANVQHTIMLTLVNDVRVSPDAVSVFNHPENAAKIYVSYGSGFYKITSTMGGDAAKLTFSEAGKSFDVVPKSPGAFVVTVRDECLLHSTPVNVDIRILTVANIRVDVIDKIEIGKTIEAYLKVLDSEGNVLSDANLLNLRAYGNSSVFTVDCGDDNDDGGKSKEREGIIVCTVTGVELGTKDLIFEAGSANSVIRSVAVPVLVYPPLQIVPRSITLVPGAVVQLSVLGGPEPNCNVEFTTTNNDAVVVDGAGNVFGHEIGEAIVTAKAVGTKGAGDGGGEKIVYSTDSIRANVVYLEGVRIKTPLSKIKTGAKMPVWIEGIPKPLDPSVLASVDPCFVFQWDVSSMKLAKIENILEETGIKVQDNDKISMRIRTLKSGRVVVTVKVTAPKNAVRAGHKGVFTDSINVEIFDDLQISNDRSRPMLLAPGIRYQLKTNKDQIAKTKYEIVNENCGSTPNSVFDIDEKGVISTHNSYDFGTVQINSVENDKVVWKKRISIQIARVQYVMLNVVPELKIHPDSSLYGLPKGARLRFYVSYHDNEGSEFTATDNHVKFALNKVDKLRVSQEENDKDLTVDLLVIGTTVVKVFDSDSTIAPDFIKIRTVPFIQPDKAKAVVGEVICFNAPVIVTEEYSCVWNTSDETSLSIDRKTGLAIAKSKQSNVVVSYRCSNDVQISTTMDVYSLQKIKIANDVITNISNNEKRYVIPLTLLNENERLYAMQVADPFERTSCVNDRSRFHYPYECDIKFKEEYTLYDIKSLFKVYSYYDSKYGHSCVIEAKDVSLPVTSQSETDIVLRISWNRHDSTSVAIPFKPAIVVDSKKLTITDKEPVDVIQIYGVPRVLKEVVIIPSDGKYVAIVEDVSDSDNALKYSVYLKPAYLKETREKDHDLSISIISPTTLQNITIPIAVNADLYHYVTPFYFTDLFMYYAQEYASKLTVALIVIVVVYFGGMKLYKIRQDRISGAFFADMSHDRSHLVDPSLSPHYVYKKPSFNEIQMIYGRPERSLRSRRN